MRRLLTIFATVAALLFNAAVVASEMPDLQRAMDAIHAALHAADPHHHGDDGSTRFDTSDESLQHMEVDPVATVAAVLPAQAVVSTAALRFFVAPPRHGLPRPDPFLEGLRRPPR